MKTNNIIRIFTDVDMRCSHIGLSKIADKENVLLDELDSGEHILFLNRKGSKMKIYSKNNILSYLSSDKRLELSTLKYFTECFGAKGFQYNEALKKVLLEKLRK